ncbi:MAG: TIGR03915 family putative DNA repair protein [Eubacteriales bacterium]|nr:TIGR03915 family putative DNA repair protein [Eubacteriales bacterium]MDD4389771.1 TIGR03915 family putative DNA repair protein [Eubacteriales bacterium]
MTEYIYDATFEGFLCCVHAHYYSGKASNILPAEDCLQASLLRTVEIKTDEEKADIVYRAIEQKISPFDLRRVYRIFLSGEKGKEMQLLEYIRLGFIKGKSISSYHGNPTVRNAELLEKKVTMEAHRLNGLIRFSVLEGEVLYARIEPDNNVLELLVPHFADRFKSSPFIIHDLRRKRALIAESGQWYISNFAIEDVECFAETEIEYRQLWKNYFDSIAIKERTNPRCQKNFMPVRYWKHLTEMQ